MTAYATPEEFCVAFAALPREQMLALQAYARRCIDGTRYSDPMDVIHDAALRILDGRRHWPRGVDLAAFLAGCVKSLASHDRHKGDAKALSLDSALERSSRGAGVDLETAPSAEQEAIRRQRESMSQDAVDFARRLLDQDFDGMRVLNGMVADLSANEMKSAFKMNHRTYNAARSRVMNRLRIWAERNPGY